MKKIQLCRDNNGEYVMCPLQSVKPQKEYGSWTQKNRKGKEVNIDLWEPDGHRFFGHLKLKPGDGPVRVEITAKFAD